MLVNSKTKQSHIVPKGKELLQPVRKAVSYRGLFTAGWFGVREKYCSRLEIYDRLRANELADCRLQIQSPDCPWLQSLCRCRK